MGFAKIIEKFMSDHKIWLEALTAIGAIFFGIMQLKINRRLAALQSYVAITATLPPEKPCIVLNNTGKTNLYLHGFEVKVSSTITNTVYYEHPRLMPAGVNEDSALWLHGQLKPEFANQVVNLTIFMKDEFGNEWVSMHGLNVREVVLEGDGTFAFNNLAIWTYKISKTKWSVKIPKDEIHNPFDSEEIIGVIFKWKKNRSGKLTIGGSK